MSSSYGPDVFISENTLTSTQLLRLDEELTKDKLSIFRDCDMITVHECDEGIKISVHYNHTAATFFFSDASVLRTIIIKKPTPHQTAGFTILSDEAQALDMQNVRRIVTKLKAQSRYLGVAAEKKELLLLGKRGGTNYLCLTYDWAALSRAPQVTEDPEKTHAYIVEFCRQTAARLTHVHEYSSKDKYNKAGLSDILLNSIMQFQIFFVLTDNTGEVRDVFIKGYRGENLGVSPIGRPFNGHAIMQQASEDILSHYDRSKIRVNYF